MRKTLLPALLALAAAVSTQANPFGIVHSPAAATPKVATPYKLQPQFSTVTIDRTKFGLQYGSKSYFALIDDNFALTFNVIAKK